MKNGHYVLLLALSLGGCSEAKESWDHMWAKKPKAAAAAIAPAPTEATVAMSKISAQGTGEAIGTLALKDGPDGLHIMTDLKGLPRGQHGFHVHQTVDCAPGMKDGKMAAGIAAGGHFDPAKTGAHAGPMGAGHAGDLPVLTVSKNGIAKEELVAPRLKVGDVIAHAFIIHAGPDNYSDKPQPLGGGGARIACGVAQ